MTYLQHYKKCQISTDWWDDWDPEKHNYGACKDKSGNDWRHLCVLCRGTEHFLKDESFGARLEFDRDM